MREYGIRRLLAILLTVLLVLPQPMGAAAVDKAVNETGGSAEGGDISKIDNPRSVGEEHTIWDCIWFGNYWQEDTNGDGHCFRQDIYSDGTEIKYHADNKQPVKWRVLEIEPDGTALLLSDKLIDVAPYSFYSSALQDETWKTSVLRSYLNSYGSSENSAGYDYEHDGFINNAFIGAELKAIKKSEVKNPDNPVRGTKGGDDTEDQVFCLSIDEARNEQYGFKKNSFVNNKDWQSVPQSTEADPTRVAVKTLFTDNKPGYDGTGAGKASCWWLRTPAGSYRGAHVFDDGAVDSGSEYKGGDNDCVRPAFRMNLASASSLWSYAGTVCSDGTVNEVKDSKLDVWKMFTNNAQYFCTNDDPADRGIEISAGDYVRLINSCSDVERERIDQRVYKERDRKGAKNPWAGSCFGMSSVVVLKNEGYIDISGFQDEEESRGIDVLHSTPIRKNKYGDRDVGNIESMINFYLLRQCTGSFYSEKENANKKLGLFPSTVDSRNLEEIVEKLENNIGHPCLLDVDLCVKKLGIFWSSSGKHAVVAYNFKRTSKDTCQFDVYDCSRAPDRVYKVNVSRSSKGDFTAECAEWTEDWHKTSFKTERILFLDAFSAGDLYKAPYLSAPAPIPPAGGKEEDKADTSYRMDVDYGSFTISNGEKSAVIEDGNKISGDLDVECYGLMNMIGEPDDYHYRLPMLSGNRMYVINPSGDEDSYDTMVSFDHPGSSFFVNVEAEDSGTITLSAGGDIETSYEGDVKQEITLYSDLTSEVPWDDVVVSGKSKGFSLKTGADRVGLETLSDTSADICVRTGFNSCTFSNVLIDNKGIAVVPGAGETGVGILRDGGAADNAVLGYYVVFDSRMGTPVETLNNVIPGSVISRPDDPQRPGYDFGGWYRDETCRDKWDFNKDTVTKDTVLYAGWYEEGSTEEEDRNVTLVPGEVRRLSLDRSGEYLYGVNWTVSFADPKVRCVSVRNGVVTAKNLKKGVLMGKATVTASYCGVDVPFEITVDGRAPENKAIIDGNKKYRITAPKVVKAVTGKSTKQMKVSIPKQLRDDRYTLSVNIVKADGQSISSESWPAAEASRHRFSFTMVDGETSARYILWSISNEKGTTQAVTKLLLTKPIEDLSVNGAETGLFLKAGESSLLMVTGTKGNTDPRELTFSVSGKGVRCSKSGCVTATAPGCEAKVTVKAGKISKTIDVKTTDDYKDHYIALNRTSVNVTRPKTGGKPRVSALRITLPKKEVPKVVWGIRGYPEGVELTEKDGTVTKVISVDDNGKVTVTDKAFPGVYLVTAAPVDTASGYNPVCCEIVVK